MAATKGNATGVGRNILLTPVSYVQKEIQMIYLIDEGGDYESNVTLVIEGDLSPEGTLAAYQDQLDSHLKEARQLTAKSEAFIGKKPKLSERSGTNKFRLWQGRLSAYLDKNSTIQAPELEDYLSNAGFKILDYSVASLSR